MPPATPDVTANGARFGSSCSLPRGFRRSICSQSLVIMLQCNKSIRRKEKYVSRRFGGGLCSVAGLLVLLWSATAARPSAPQGGASQPPKLSSAPTSSAVKSFPPKSDKDDFRLTVET